MTYHQISAPHISASMAANCFAAPRPSPARGGHFVLASPLWTLTNGSSGGLCWTFYVEVVRCVVGLTSADGAVVVSRSARLRSWSASGGDRGCCTRVGASMGRLFATRVRTPAPFIVFGIVSHALTVCRRILPLGSTLHRFRARARQQRAPSEPCAHLHVRARAVRAMRRLGGEAARSLPPRWRADGRGRLLHHSAPPCCECAHPCAQAS